MRNRPRQRTRVGWIKRALDVTKIGPTLRESGVICGEGDPLAVDGYYDRTGSLRRLHATYAGGWWVKLYVRADGTYSITQGVRLTIGKPVSA